MRYLLWNYGKLPRILALLLVSIILTTGVFVAAGLVSGSDTNIYLPIVVGGNGTVAGNNLEDGGVVSGLDGVTIGAVSGTLSASLLVEISETTMPSAALPGGAQAQSKFYSLSADQDVYTHESSTFILGLPVPAGVTTSNLAIAVYFTDTFNNVDSWIIIPGLYDAARNLILVQLPALTTTAQTAVLVEHQGLSSPPVSTAVQAAKAAGSSQFEVRCLTIELLYENCMLDKYVVEEELQNVFGEMISMGYPPPHLMSQAAHLSLDPPDAQSGNTYVITVATDVGKCLEGVLGFYAPVMEWLNLCYIPNSSMTTEQTRNIRHEYFHATQSAFPATYDDHISRDSETWIIEGTASTAEESDATSMNRDPVRALHFVDRSLKSEEDVDEYKAQDFWVFLGRVSGTALDRFITLFEQGAKTEDVANWIGSMDGLKSWYWRWVKNQVMVEENITFDGELGQPCILQTEVVETLRNVDVYNEGMYQGSLPPMTAHVIEIIIDPDLEGLPQIGVWVNDDSPYFPPPMPDPDLQYKVYVEGETCTSIPDGSRFLYDLTTAKTYYIVVSNTNPDNTRPYTVYFD